MIFYLISLIFEFMIINLYIYICSRSISEPNDITQILESLVIMFIARTIASRMIRHIFNQTEINLLIKAKKWLNIPSNINEKKKERDQKG